MELVARGLRRIFWVSCETRRRKSSRRVVVCGWAKRGSSASFSACLAQLVMKDLKASVAAGSKGRFLRRSLRASSSVMQAGRK